MRTRKRRLVPTLALIGSVGAVVSVAAPAVADSLPTAAFALGDGNVASTSPVTFWGSQWWKDNQVSTGSAPAAFKGYAAEVDPIGCTFTTRPGNSAPPPSDPLPSVITVLVTSSITKTGSTITGKISEFAFVATENGYDSNPGHPGTGTVIGVMPCGGQL